MIKDDAGARDFKLILDLRQHGTESVVGPGMAKYQGPSIIAYNSAKFQDADFQSIQRIGDSLKKVRERRCWRCWRCFIIDFIFIYYLVFLKYFLFF